LTISDDGIGMPEEVSSRIFEPFFTTKQIGQGTGLGLSVVQTIVTDHRGFLKLHSVPNEGTSASIYLPCIKSGKQNTDKSIPLQKIAGGNETILLVEDEEQVRDLAQLVLGQSGYEVLSAEDGELGLQIFKENMDRISLVVCDVVMPNMGGPQLLKMINDIDSSIPFLFVSGYVGDADPAEFADQYGVKFLQKPFSASELQEEVRQILDAAAPGRLNILIADDSEANRNLLVIDLEELGHNVTSANDGSAALNKCRQQQFDYIFMDIQMPGLDGIETTRQIRANNPNDVTIIGLTANIRSAEKRACLAAGMSEVRTKPMSMADLERLLGDASNNGAQPITDVVSSRSSGSA
jgi:CheY-like chemotaxis protein